MKLPLLRLEVAHKTGVEVFAPVSMIMEFLEKHDQEERWLPFDPSCVSVISGKPAVVYRTDDFEIPLTIEELRRLALSCLTPDEFKALHAEVGPIFEIHDDFYDAETGEALQPKV